MNRYQNGPGFPWIVALDQWEPATISLLSDGRGPIFSRVARWGETATLWPLLTGCDLFPAVPVMRLDRRVDLSGAVAVWRRLEYLVGRVPLGSGRLGRSDWDLAAIGGGSYFLWITACWQAIGLWPPIVARILTTHLRTAGLSQLGMS